MWSSSTSESYNSLGFIAVFGWPWLVCLCDPYSNQVNFFLMIVRFDKTIGFDISKKWFITLVIWSRGEDFLVKSFKYLHICLLVDSIPSLDNDPNAYPPFNSLRSDDWSSNPRDVWFLHAQENFHQSVNYL